MQTDNKQQQEQAGRYPEIKTVQDVPYFQTLKRKLIYAREFHPSKVAYYEELIKQWEERFIIFPLPTK